jgi:hypothetical protein
LGVIVAAARQFGAVGSGAGSRVQNRRAGARVAAGRAELQSVASAECGITALKHQVFRIFGAVLVAVAALGALCYIHGDL